jgi:hypothetical protein
MTKSKTKLLTLDRKFSVKRSVVEKAAEEIYAAMGIEYKKKHKTVKPLKIKA